MGIELGRISGPLLASNLVRKNSGAGEENLAFETNLLYLDVVNGRVGVKTNSPAAGYALHVNGTSRSDDLEVPTQFETPNYVLSTNRIQNLVDKIYLQPNQTLDPIIQAPRFETLNLGLDDALIENITSDSDINLNPNGIGKTSVTSSKLYTDGNVHATGDITWDGNITFGSDASDNVEFSADVNSHIIPNTNKTRDLGSASQRWNRIYTKDLKSESLTYDTITINNINLLLTQGNTYYVSVNGNDSYVGDHLHNTYRTIKYALSQATAGDTVVIFPGVYEEIFPLTVPTGVTINGAGIRAVTVKPTVGTNTNNAFLLNGETTVSNLTVKDFYAPGSAFCFANNFTVTSRSPYVQNVSVITKESVVATYTENYSLVAGDWTSGFFYAQPNANIISLNTNLAQLSFYSALELTPSGTVFNVVYNDNTTDILTQTSSSSYFGAQLNIPAAGFSTSSTKSIKSISWGQINTPQNDAGNGALVDGSLANSASREASMLFQSITMIVPNAIGIRAINGARVEWLNSFTYFAFQGIHLLQGTAGFANLGVKFGAEIRSIGSANVYGTYGAVADGANTLAYLVSHNFAYIGTGTDSTNDPELSVPAFEVVEVNNGHIYYESADHKGDVRIGNIFYVNQETGVISFNAQLLSFNPLGAISVEGGTSPSYIDREMVVTGNIKIYGNNIDSLSGPVNFLASSGSTFLNTNVFVTGNTTVSSDINVDGNLFLGNQSTDTITVFSNLTQDLLPDDVGPAGGFSLGNTLTKWSTLYSNALTVDNVTKINNNTISTLTTDTNLIFRAVGANEVQVTNTDVQINNNLTVINDLTVNGTANLKNTTIGGVGSPKTLTLVGNYNQTGNTYITGDVLVSNNKNLTITGTGSYFTVPDIKLQNSEISVTATNQDLVLQGTGIGGVVFEDLIRFSGTQIIAQAGLALAENGALLVTENGVPLALEGDAGATESLVFTPNGTGSAIIDTTNAIRIPVGDNSLRTLSFGEIRYNPTSNLYEGGGATGGLISFNGLYDSDRNTYISTGATDNTIYFGINNVVNTTLNSTSLNSNIFEVGNVRLTGNTLSNIVSGNNLTFAPNGTGNTVLNGVPIGQDYIVNSLNSSLNLVTTGSGYVKFSGTGGLVVPTGDDSTRRGTPDLGELRYNTQAAGVLEIFDGTQWISAVGNNATVSAEDVLDVLELWTLILG